jgi:hypothetical protein
MPILFAESGRKFSESGQGVQGREDKEDYFSRCAGVFNKSIMSQMVLRTGRGYNVKDAHPQMAQPIRFAKQSSCWTN